MDSVYAALTLGGVAFILAAMLQRPPAFTGFQRAALFFAFVCCVASLGFFALLSVRYDFHDCYYPSTAHPFFVSGRLMLGTLVPFMILFACGLDRLLQAFQNSTKYVFLIALLAFTVASEITIDWQIFPNEYNWFHN